MTTSIRKNYSAAFKSKVALEAIKEESTLSELSAKYQVHSTQIKNWKQQALEGISGTFSDEKSRKSNKIEEDTSKLHEKIGQLVVERDFLLRASHKYDVMRGKK